MKDSDLPRVALRGGFSDRMGINPINTEMQMTHFDERTRVYIVNLINGVYKHVYEFDLNGGEKTTLFNFVLSNVYSQQISYDKNSRYDEEWIFREFINKTILCDTYDAVLTLVEYLVQRMDESARKYRQNIDICRLFNKLFEKEYVGYRFIDRKIVPITGEEEVVEINKALNVPFQNVNKHLEKSMVLLSNRDKPDYENSIKESISAVEALCADILGNKGTLGDALKKMEEKNIYIHPALKEAFLKLYGYTNDASSGIRHAAKLGGAESTFQEARYMLVSCSAFINYLISMCSETGR